MVIYGLYMKIDSTLAFITVLLTSNLHKLSKEILNFSSPEGNLCPPGSLNILGDTEGLLGLDNQLQ